MVLHGKVPVMQNGEYCNQWWVDVTLSDGRRVDGYILLDNGGSDFWLGDGSAVECPEGDFEAIAVAPQTTDVPVTVND